MKGEMIMEKTANISETFIDPVCAMKIGHKEHTFTYKNYTYYFCAEACRKKFETKPEKYLKEDPAKRKGIWGRYLDRLNRATGGRAQQCC